MSVVNWGTSTLTTNGGWIQRVGFWGISTHEKILAKN